MNKDHLTLAFAGTPDFAACALKAVITAGYPVSLVLTQPDRPAGRGMKLAASAVKQTALAHELPLWQPLSLRDAATVEDLLASPPPDVLVVAAYGLILPQIVLDWPRLGCINIHASLLPRWRGAAPIQRAIEAGDSETGISLMQMDAGLDTGAVLARGALPIAADDTAASLHDKLADLGAQMLLELLGRLRAGESLPASPQAATGVTYANKISKAEARLDWSEPATGLERKMRAFTPFPGVSAVMRETVIKCWRGHAAAAGGVPGEVLAVSAAGIQVACGEGSLVLTELQKPGARRLAVADFIAGFELSVGDRLQ